MGTCSGKPFCSGAGLRLPLLGFDLRRINRLRGRAGFDLKLDCGAHVCHLEPRHARTGQSLNCLILRRFRLFILNFVLNIEVLSSRWSSVELASEYHAR